MVVLYEDTKARESAEAFCDYLVNQFWVESGLDVSWWSFDALREGGSASKAVEKARETDWLILTLRPERELSPHLKNWIETWLSRRGKREGTLVGLVNAAPGRLAVCAETQPYLRQVAHRAGMDYLNQMPQTISQPITDARDSYTERANQQTSVLDEILHHPSRPPAALL
jgi:hypothetical protein